MADIESLEAERDAAVTAEQEAAAAVASAEAKRHEAVERAARVQNELDHAIFEREHPEEAAEYKRKTEANAKARAAALAATGQGGV